MSDQLTKDVAKKEQSQWTKELAKFAKPDWRKSIWQMTNTILPYLGLWALMIFLVNNHYSYWLILGIAPVAGLFLVRIFIFFHDCCHGSFFKSRKANRIVGYITGFLTFTPFDDWRFAHNVHHSNSGDLSRRGVGDVWTMTVNEYRASGFLKRLGYRLFRNPVVMFGFGPFFWFFVSMRLPNKSSGKKEILSVLVTNLAMLVIVLSLGYLIGYAHFFMILLPVLFVAGMSGIWLFYVQHQFEDTYWSENEEWTLLQSALAGSSYYKLPKVLQWFTGNIGLHHIHHLRPGIPNYNLQACINEIIALQQVEPLTIKKSLKSLWLDLWDEQTKKLVSFRSLKKAYQT